MNDSEHFDTVIIGGGQAGLTAGTTSRSRIVRS